MCEGNEVQRNGGSGRFRVKGGQAEAKKSFEDVSKTKSMTTRFVVSTAW